MLQGKIKQTMEKAFWDGIMENEAGVVGLASFSSHDMGTVAWVVNYEIYPLWYSIYAGICVVYHL